MFFFLLSILPFLCPSVFLVFFRFSLSLFLSLLVSYLVSTLPFILSFFPCPIFLCFHPFFFSCFSWLPFSFTSPCPFSLLCVLCFSYILRSFLSFLRVLTSFIYSFLPFFLFIIFFFSPSLCPTSSSSLLWFSFSSSFPSLLSSFLPCDLLLCCLYSSVLCFLPSWLPDPGLSRFHI